MSPAEAEWQSNLQQESNHLSQIHEAHLSESDHESLEQLLRALDAVEFQKISARWQPSKKQGSKKGAYHKELAILQRAQEASIEVALGKGVRLAHAEIPPPAAGLKAKAPPCESKKERRSKPSMAPHGLAPSVNWNATSRPKIRTSLGKSSSQTTRQPNGLQWTPISPASTYQPTALNDDWQSSVDDQRKFLEHLALAESKPIVHLPTNNGQPSEAPDTDLAPSLIKQEPSTAPKVYSYEFSPPATSAEGIEQQDVCEPEEAPNDGSLVKAENGASSTDQRTSESLDEADIVMNISRRYHSDFEEGEVSMEESSGVEELTLGAKDPDPPDSDTESAKQFERQLKARTTAAPDGHLDTGAVMDPPPTETAPPHAPLTLADLSSADLRVQLRYFYTTRDPSTVPGSDPARCLLCAFPGHTAAACPALTCAFCNAYAAHPAQFCPALARCSRCRARGHDVSACPYRFVPDGATFRACALCGHDRHPEARCELRWRTSGPLWRRPLPASSVVTRYCHECGARGHLANDCPRRRPGKPWASSMWGEAPVPPPHDLHVAPPRRPAARGRAPAGAPPLDYGDPGRFRGNKVRQDGPRKPIRFADGIGGGGRLESSNTYRGTARSADSYAPHSGQMPLRRSRSPPRRQATGTFPQGAGGESYRPMPSAAERAWKRARY